jgi:hypothetical protein
MSDLTAAALVVLQRQLGHVSASQLSAAGVTETARRRLLEQRVLESIGHWVYRVPGSPNSLDARLVALCLQHPSGFVTGPTGGGLMELRRMPKASKVHFCVPHGQRFDAPNFVQLRQSTVIDPVDTRVLPNGVRIANWARLAFDLGADLGFIDLLSVVEQMVQRRDCTMDDFLDVARRLSGPRRAGSQMFARVLLQHHGGPATESHPELTVLRGLQRRGVPVTPQVADLRLLNGRSVRIDMAVPAMRWAVEVDVHPHHLGLVGTSMDKQRDRQLHLIDWQVERVSALDFIDLDATFGELARLFDRRCEALASRTGRQ